MNNNWYQSKLHTYQESKDPETTIAMGRKDTGVKIPQLDKDNYFHWKIKMRLHLMSLHEGYVRCIEHGPYVPVKPRTAPTTPAATGATEGTSGDSTAATAPAAGVARDRTDIVVKPISEYSPEDIEEVHKDKKTMNILFNGLDTNMFDNVINCTTAKEVWDTIHTLCEGTDQVKENKMQLLIQQYEHFHFKLGETLNDTFNRF